MTGKDIATTRQGQFVPANLDERVRFAQLMADADMLPRQYRERPANVLLAMEYGDSLGIPYAQAISTINVIEGKPSASAALISALVRRAGHRLRISGDDEHAVATIVRSDDPEFEYRSEWTVARAERAGLCQVRDGKPYARSQGGKVLPWEAYTAALLKARAITEVAREACQEALMGVQYTPEELGAVVDEDGEPVDVPKRTAAPRRVRAETVPPVRPCGHPGDPNTKCGTCVAEQHNGQRGPDEDGDRQVVDAEPEPHPETVAEPAEARPQLPDDFDLIVQNAEENLDKPGLLDLHALADAAGDRMAVAAVLAAGKRVATHLEQQEQAGA